MFENREKPSEFNFAGLKELSFVLLVPDVAQPAPWPTPVARHQWCGAKWVLLFQTETEVSGEMENGELVVEVTGKNVDVGKVMDSTGVVTEVLCRVNWVKMVR